MDAALIILRFVLPVVFGGGTVFTILALRRAPVGREDEDGFHFIESTDAPVASRAEGAGHVVPSSNGPLTRFYLPSGGH